ncbi:alpha/beta hydrolase [Nonomuraea sp. NPDC048916]|uniref:alpha/beta fold hydrolase n=1 Tax=Nonomuraea sp. NPDC048916 TaxID=3154232 RepID=UPI0033E1A2FC
MTSARTTTATVTSSDGTSIAYRRLGDGPGLVLLHGAMQSGYSNIEFARALSGEHTCYVPDRRGRGLSGPVGDDYGVHKEVEDLDALLTATGARDVIGISSGAVIALRTALVRPDLRRLVAFEPPLDVDGSNATDWLGRFDREIAAGRVAAALVTGMRGTRMGSPVFRALPRWLLERLTATFMARQERQAEGEEPTFRALAPTLHQDALVVAETADVLDVYRSVRAEVLLLGGSRSPAYLKGALAALEPVLPSARRVELPGVDHQVTCNAAMGGRPALAADEVRRFLA